MVGLSRLSPVAAYGFRVIGFARVRLASESPRAAIVAGRFELSLVAVLPVAHGLFIAAFLPRPPGHPCAATNI